MAIQTRRFFRVLSYPSQFSIHQLLNLARYRRFKYGVYSEILPYRPVDLAAVITSKCNLKCAMCPFHAEGSSYEPEPYEDMSFETFKQILVKFKQAINLTLTGEGEPFLHKDILKMTDYASKKHRMRVSTSTNGTLIEDKIEDIVRSSFQRLNVSLDGISSERYAVVRKGGGRTYRTIVSNIQQLVETRNKLGSKMNLRISHLVTKQNFKDIPEIITLAEELGVDDLFLHNVVGFDTELSKPSLCLFEDDLEVVALLKETSKPERLNVVFPTLYSRNGHKRICGDPFSYIGVNSNGDVGPCCNLKTNLAIGNVFKEKDVWNNSEFQKVRRKFIAGELPFSVCKYCFTVY